jgi:hypothetical protein
MLGESLIMLTGCFIKMKQLSPMLLQHNCGDNDDAAFETFYTSIRIESVDVHFLLY